MKVRGLVNEKLCRAVANYGEGERPDALGPRDTHESCNVGASDERVATSALDRPPHVLTWDGQGVG
jgi:hypothetical protein